MSRTLLTLAAAGAIVFTSLPASAQCTSNPDCGAGTPFCDVGTGTCVECLASPDCGETDATCGTVCVANACSAGIDCTGAGDVCSAGVCVECINDLDCGAGTPFCDVGTGTCVECLASPDCGESDATCGTVCVANVCSAGVDCTGAGDVCSAGVCVSTTSTTAVTTSTTTTTTTTVPMVPSGDNYQCYKSKDLKNPQFQSLTGVSLIDEFGSSTAEVKKPFLVCTPVDTDGSGVADPDKYMCCYKTKGVKLDPEARVETGDQFGTLQQSFRKAQLLCQPCSRTVLP